MKIGIFGGCFNPPHNMHKSIALDLINKNYLDKVIYVPTGDKYNKKELVEASHRYNMVKLMIENNPNLLVSDYEIKNKLTYTYQTLDYFKNKYPNDEIYFICGSDNLLELNTWRNYDYIINNYKILVIKRNRFDKVKINKNIILTDISMNDISSTMIRKDLNYILKNNNLDIKIYNYIKENKLYE